MSVMSTFRAILETTNLGALLSLGSTADVMLKKPWIVLMGTGGPGYHLKRPLWCCHLLLRCYLLPVQYCTARQYYII